MLYREFQASAWGSAGSSAPSNDRIRRDEPGYGPIARTLVVDDQPLFRQGARDLMERSGTFQVVGEAGSGLDGIQLASSLVPDLVLLELRLRDMDGAQVLRRLRESGLPTRIAVVTASSDPGDLHSALRAGADAYLLKNTEPPRLLAQLQQVVAGRVVLGDGLGEALARSIRENRSCEAIERAGLTEREKAILQRIAGGCSNRRIAEDLAIAEATVKVHVKHLLKKLHLHSRVEAALWCLNQRAHGGLSANPLPGGPAKRTEAIEPAQRRMPEDQDGREG
jgi:two-component system, NarL family, nitrate/nitrite response regulator NarL